MTDSKFRANRAFPNPITVTDDPRSHTLALQQIIEALQIGQRRTKDIRNSYVRLSELEGMGLITISGNSFNVATGGGGVADHGALTGLADDDHPQYGAVAQNETVTGNWTFSGLVRATAGGYEWLRLESDGAAAVSGSYIDLKSDVYSEFLIRSYVDDNYGPTMTFYKARGTKASPTANVTGDQLGGFFWGSRGSSGWVFPAAVDFTTTANTTTTAAGHLDFKVGPNFAGLASLLRLYTSGDIGIRGPILLGSAEDVGTAGQILTSQGAGNDPTWEDAPTGGGGGGSIGLGANPKYLFEFFDDFTFPYRAATDAATGGWVPHNSGTGSSVVFSSTADSTHPGVVACATGTATGGAAGIGHAITPDTTLRTNGLVLHPTDETVFEGVFKVSDLPDATNNYECRIGLQQAYFGVAGVQHVRASLIYDSGLTSVAWRLANNDGTAGTATHTGAAGVTADTWFHLKIVATTASTKLYINGVLLLTNTSNVPTGQLPWSLGIVKSAGSTSRTLSCDLIWIHRAYATPRDANISEPDIGVGINALTDVDTTTVAPRLGDSLLFDGTKWITFSPRNVTVQFDDFKFYPAPTAFESWDSLTSGTGAAVSPGSAKTGSILLSSGTGSGAYAGVMRSRDAATSAEVGYILGTSGDPGAIIFRCRMRWTANIPSNSVADNCFMRIGLSDEITGAPAAGIYFATDSVVGSGAFAGKIYGLVRNPTIQEATGGTPHPIVLNTWVLLEFRVDPDGGGVQFYVDGVNIGTVTTATNIPAGAALAQHAQIQRAGSAGTNHRVEVDYIEVVQFYNRQ